MKIYFKFQRSSKFIALQKWYYWIAQDYRWICQKPANYSPFIARFGLSKWSTSNRWFKRANTQCARIEQTVRIHDENRRCCCVCSFRNNWFFVFLLLLVPLSISRRIQGPFGDPTEVHNGESLISPKDYSARNLLLKCTDPTKEYLWNSNDEVSLDCEFKEFRKKIVHGRAIL